MQVKPEERRKEEENSSQCSLLVLTEKWRRILDKGGHFDAFLTDLSKAFDLLSHELMVAKLHAYGFDFASIKLILNYLSFRKQKVKIGNQSSPWGDVTLGVPQGSILGPLLFNIYISDMFMFVDIDVANYADDSTPYYGAETNDEVVEKLQSTADTLFDWFSFNGMKANPDKCHLLLSNEINFEVIFNEILIGSSEHEKLLGVTIT